MPNSAVERPLIARNKGYYAELEQGRVYAWCSCGRSGVQPFCDGSHAGTAFRPARYRAVSKEEEVVFCGCKRTRTPPFCDGSHNGLQNPEADSAEKLDAADAAIRADGRTVLNGGCYVVSSGRVPKIEAGSLKYCALIGPEYGSIHQSLFHFEATEGVSPVVSFGDRDAVLFVFEGELNIEISGRRFLAARHSGVYVRAGEAFRVSNADRCIVRFLITVCPRTAMPEFSGAMPTSFDETYPERVVPLDPSQRHSMANRYFQMLVDKTVGSKAVAQFIGHIPRSKAEPHRHLYEESLIVLSGQGRMWTENLKASVETGDVIFLPRKQAHSLEAFGDKGMLVVGTICPGDNPAISY